MSVRLETGLDPLTRRHACRRGQTCTCEQTQTIRHEGKPTRIAAFGTHGEVRDEDDLLALRREHSRRVRCARDVDVRHADQFAGVMPRH